MQEEIVLKDQHRTCRVSRHPTKLFRKYSIFPATQNKDERLFSLIGRNTGALSRRIKIETIEKKVVVGSAIQKHGFIFDYQKGHDSSSSDDESFV